MQWESTSPPFVNGAKEMAVEDKSVGLMSAELFLNPSIPYRVRVTGSTSVGYNETLVPAYIAIGSEQECEFIVVHAE